VQEHWRSFVEQLESDWTGPGGLPPFVSDEIEAFLRCEIPAHGVIVARCRECGWSRAVAFSCQRRGFCPSCIGRRMCDFAARLVTNVLPDVPVRQWVNIHLPRCALEKRRTVVKRGYAGGMDGSR
jgi:hypothetical protein